MKKITQITAFFAALLLATSASAGPVAFGDPITPTCPTGGCGIALQTVLDDITVGGDSSVDVTMDEVGNVEGMDELWIAGGAGGSVSTIVIELAGFAGVNTFGIYDAADHTNTVELFAGADAAGTSKLLSILADGSIVINFADTTIDFAANKFGFYLGSPQGLFYSETSLNADSVDHLAAYQGVGDMIQILPFAAGPWTANEYILGWEDLAGGGDRDYTDFVVIVESISPVPAPGTLVLLGLALAGLGARGRKA